MRLRPDAGTGFKPETCLTVFALTDRHHEKPRTSICLSRAFVNSPGNGAESAMTHTMLDILLYVLMAGGVGFMIGQVWPGRLSFLGRQEPARASLAGAGADALPEFPLPPPPGLLPSAGARNAAPAPSERDAPRNSETARAELAKWQQRASRLATALRERELAVRDRDATIARLQQSADALRKLHTEDPVTAGSRVRDELIAELETLLQSESARYREALAERDTRVAEAAQLTEQLAIWKQKWRDSAGVLDQRDATVADLERNSKDLRRALDTATTENKRLRVTAEASATRIEELEQQKRDSVQALQTELERAQAATESQQNLNAELMQSLEERRHRILELETEISALNEVAEYERSLAAQTSASAASPAIHPVQTSSADDRRDNAQAAQADVAAMQQSDADAVDGAGGPDSAADKPWALPTRDDAEYSENDYREAALPAAPANLLDHAPARADDLTRMRGVGEKLERRLNALGIYQFDQIAAFDRDDIAWVEEQLGAFKGRIARDRWVEQASEFGCGAENDAALSQGSLRSASAGQHNSH